MPRRRKANAARAQLPSATPQPNAAAYARLVAEADRLGLPATARYFLERDEYKRLHGTSGAPIPQRFGWNLQETGTQLFAADDLKDFELLTQHLAIFGGGGRGNYYIDDGNTLRQCTIADLLTWLAQRVDLRRYAEAVAVAAEELKRKTPALYSQDRAQWRAFRAAEERWSIAKGRFDYALDIVERYDDHR